MPRRSEVHQTVFSKRCEGRIRQNYSIAVVRESPADYCELGGGSHLIVGIGVLLRSADSWRPLCGWSPCLQWPPCLLPPPRLGSLCSVRPPRPLIKYKHNKNNEIGIFIFRYNPCSLFACFLHTLSFLCIFV